MDGHTKEIKAFSWSSDLEYLASGSRDNTVKIWDLKAKKFLFTLE